MSGGSEPEAGKAGKAADASKRGFKLGAVLTVLPLVSLTLSLYSLYVAEGAKKDATRTDVIKTEYGLFTSLASLQLQYPATAHLFATTNETYDLAVTEVRAALPSQSVGARATSRLQERAVAHYFFTAYEEAFYVLRQARSVGDTLRTAMASEDLGYFDLAFCGNPRLRWLWAYDGGKLGVAFAEDLRDHTASLKDCQTSKDPGGPFAP